MRLDLWIASDPRAKPHACTPHRRRGDREDSDYDGDQLPPGIVAAAVSRDRDEANHPSDAYTRCGDPGVTATHEPPQEKPRREDRQRSERERPLDAERCEHEEDGDENCQRGDPSHPSIVGRATSLVNPDDSAFMKDWAARGIAEEIASGRWRLTSSGAAMFAGWASRIDLEDEERAA